MSPSELLGQERASGPRAAPTSTRHIESADQLTREGYVRVGSVFEQGRLVWVWIGHAGVVLYCERTQRAMELSRVALLALANEAGIFRGLPA